jgi:hypothetical protein
VRTKPIRYQDQRLLLNYRCRKGGSLKVEMWTEDGSGLIALARDESGILTGDSVNHDMGWKNSNPVQLGLGQTVRLRFELKNAEVYAFQFAE